jgi:hypothetical protein
VLRWWEAGRWRPGAGQVDSSFETFWTWVAHVVRLRRPMSNPALKYVATALHSRTV